MCYLSVASLISCNSCCTCSNVDSIFLLSLPWLLTSLRPAYSISCITVYPNHPRDQRHQQIKVQRLCKQRLVTCCKLTCDHVTYSAGACKHLLHAWNRSHHMCHACCRALEAIGKLCIHATASRTMQDHASSCCMRQQMHESCLLQGLRSGQQICTGVLTCHHVMLNAGPCKQLLHAQTNACVMRTAGSGKQLLRIAHISPWCA